MDSISLTCPTCQESLQFPPDKAGSKGHCSKCGSAVSIPTPNRGIDEEDGGAYGLVDVVVEKKALPIERKKDKSVLDPSLRKKKKLQDADKWNVVRGGLTVMSMAAAAWGLVYALQMGVVLLGCYRETEYNPPRVRVLFNITKEDDLEPEAKRFFNRNRFVLSLLYGTDYLTYFRTAQILLALLSIFPVVLFIMGYIACSKPPRRFGMRGQIRALWILAIVNAVIVLLFRVLPLSGIFAWGPLPYMIPELPMINANAERMTPLHVMWMRLPYLEEVLTMIFICCQFAEFALGGVFIYTMGFTIKDEEIRDAGVGLVHLSLGTALAFIVYHLFSLCGCSVVLINVLRIIYLFAVGGQFYLIYSYMSVLNQARATLDKRMEGMTEEELEFKDEDDEYEDDDDDDEDDEDEDDEEDEDRKKKRRRPRYDDDEDDGEDAPKKRKQKRRVAVEDDDEDRPRKRKKR